MAVVAIDVGVKNLAYCAMTWDGTVIEWENTSLLGPNEKYKPSQLVPYVVRWVRDRAIILQTADKVIVERQMRCNMRIIEAVLQTLLFDRCTVVPATDIKDCFGLRRHNYRLNKKAAVQHVRDLLEAKAAVCQIHANWLTVFDSSGKKDDLADSYLMALAFSNSVAPQSHCNDDDGGG